MANVCIVRHQGYIKSKMQFPFQHNFRTLKNYGNQNIDLSLTPLNSTLINNLKDGETYQTAFKRLFESGEFKGQWISKQSFWRSFLFTRLMRKLQK